MSKINAKSISSKAVARELKIDIAFYRNYLFMRKVSQRLISIGRKQEKFPIRLVLNLRQLKLKWKRLLKIKTTSERRRILKFTVARSSENI